MHGADKEHIGTRTMWMVQNSLVEKLGVNPANNGVCMAVFVVCALLNLNCLVYPNADVYIMMWGGAVLLCSWYMWCGHILMVV
jgi:hypothetical protein